MVRSSKGFQVTETYNGVNPSQASQLGPHTALRSQSVCVHRTYRPKGAYTVNPLAQPGCKASEDLSANSVCAPLLAASRVQ